MGRLKKRFFYLIDKLLIKALEWRVKEWKKHKKEDKDVSRTSYRKS